MILLWHTVLALFMSWIRRSKVEFPWDISTYLSSLFFLFFWFYSVTCLVLVELCIELLFLKIFKAIFISEDKIIKVFLFYNIVVFYVVKANLPQFMFVQVCMHVFSCVRSPGVLVWEPWLSVLALHLVLDRASVLFFYYIYPTSWPRRLCNYQDKF